MKKHKWLAIIAVILAAAVLVILHTVFLGSNEKFDFVPYIIGTGMALAIIWIRRSDNQ